VEGALSAALRVWQDYEAGDLRALGRVSRDADRIRRLLALAAISKWTLSRMRCRRGCRKLSARPRHQAHDRAAPAAVKQTLPPAWRKSPKAMRRVGR